MRRTPRVVLPIAEVLREDHLAVKRPRRLEDRSVPVGDPKALARL
jgi:hypothetical protein